MTKTEFIQQAAIELMPLFANIANSSALEQCRDLDPYEKVRLRLTPDQVYADAAKHAVKAAMALANEMESVAFLDGAV